MVSALVLLANGSEEIEFVTIYDILVRAGVDVVSASVGELDSKGAVKCSRGVRILADERFEEMVKERLPNFDAFIIPGGLPGAKTLAATKRVTELVLNFYLASKTVGMICAGPLVALEAKLYEEFTPGEIKLTSHPSVKEKLEEKFEYVEEDVVVHRNLITSRGPGTSILFALALIRALLGPDKEKVIRDPLMVPST